MREIEHSQQGQALAPEPIRMDASAFEDHGRTEVTWMGNASVLVNSHGTCVMIDPLLEGFDMPLLRESPLDVADVPHVDAILITHIDNDHFSRDTLADLKDRCEAVHAPEYVAGEAAKLGVHAVGHEIGDVFEVGPITVRVTPARHNWQNLVPKHQWRVWEERDYCGFYVTTPDGAIYNPGDSKLLEEQMSYDEPGLIMYDFADDDWHITLDGAVQLANAYPESALIPTHWGCVDAPTMKPFAGDPTDVYARIDNPDRLHVMAPGEVYVLR